MSQTKLLLQALNKIETTLDQCLADTLAVKTEWAGEALPITSTGIDAVLRAQCATISGDTTKEISLDAYREWLRESQAKENRINAAIELLTKEGYNVSKL